MTLRLADGRRQFRPGEVIPLELEFSSGLAKRFSVDGATYDRSGRLTIDELAIDRIDDVSDPMLDHFGSIGGSIGGGIRGIGVLGEKPYAVVPVESNTNRVRDPPARCGVGGVATRNRAPHRRRELRRARRLPDDAIPRHRGGGDRDDSALWRAGDQIGAMACSQEASILAHFLRVDEATGGTLLHRAMASRVTGCWRSLHRIAALRMTPVVERRAIADLDNPDPDVVIAAIQTLGDHGSPASLEPLRAAFQRWHAVWTGRAEELAHSRTVERPNARQALVEDAFRQAIATGRAWRARAGELRELQSLCVTDTCRTQTGIMLDNDGTRITLWAVNEPDESHIRLAQYRLTSVAALEQKLSLYPRGTAFTLQRVPDEGGDVAAAITRLKAFAAARGFSIKETGRR